MTRKQTQKTNVTTDLFSVRAPSGLQMATWMDGDGISVEFGQIKMKIETLDWNTFSYYIAQTNLLKRSIEKLRTVSNRNSQHKSTRSEK